MKKIFISIPWFYPAYKAGGPILSIVNMINELDEGYEFFVFTSNTDLNDEPVKGIKINQWQRYNPYTKVWYAGKGNRSNDLLQQAKETKPDALFIIGLFSWHFNLVPLFFCPAPNKILSVRGMLHPGALSQKRLKKEFFIGMFNLLGHDKVVFHATDSQEKEFIEARMGRHSITKIAANIPRAIKRRNDHLKEKGKLRLVTVALISPMKNYLEVLQALAKSELEIYYSIYGPVKEQGYWESCLAKIGHLPANIRVTYHGDVPPQMIPEKLYKGEVFIMPSKSENYGHAIIEALHAGLPVITSNTTPWNKLRENKAGVNVEPVPGTILESINFFAAMDDSTYNEWSNGAAAYASFRVDRNELKEAYKNLFS